MKLFIGLGNPGADYAAHRHNIGFRALDAIAAAHSFSPWKSAFKGQIAEGRLGLEKVLLLKPQTFMNLSGDSVQAAAQFYKIAPEDMLVFHDELDLAPGILRLKSGGGHAGHNGLRSLHSHLGADYRRLRIGIGHPGDKAAVARYVLSPFSKAEEMDWVEPRLAALAAAAPLLVTEDAAKIGAALAAPRAAEEPRKPAPHTPTTAPAEKEKAPGANASPLQRLIDRFR